MITMIKIVGAFNTVSVKMAKQSFYSSVSDFRIF